MNLTTTLTIPKAPPETSTGDNISKIALENYLINPVKEDGENVDRYLLDINENIYYVGEYVYHILDQIKKGAQLPSITQTLNKVHGSEVFTKEEVSRIVDEEIVKLFDKKEKKPSRVKSLFKIINPEVISFALKPMTALYNETFFKIVFPLIILFNAVYFVLIKNMALPVQEIAHTGFKQNAIYMACVFAFLFFHEIGHAVASLKYGVTPKTIGFGIYFIFPAFYTDLTEVWRLSGKERIVINAGGIYFQLMVNCFLITYLFYVPFDGLISYYIQKIVMLNIVISLYNINPFFRFDGYWIYSDYFDIPNLRQQSMAIIGKCFMKAKYFVTGTEGKEMIIERNKPLLIYTVLYVLFMGMIWYFISGFIYNVHVDLYTAVSSLESFSGADWSTILPLVFFALIPWTITFMNIKKRFTKKEKAA